MTLQTLPKILPALPVASTQPLVIFEDVSKTYPLSKISQVHAVRQVNLCVDRGEFVVITGRSGSGKTTLLNLISGLTQPTSGRVLLGEREVWKLPDAEQSRLRNREIGFVFQFASLMPSLTVLENILLPGMLQPGGKTAERQARARKLLEEVGLADRRDAFPRQLSAGEQQRVVIARALIHEPELLLADEPTSNLDEQTEHEIMELFRTIHRERGITILLVTHSTELVAYGSRAVRMANGQIID